MELGISVYIGEGYTYDKNIQYIQMARNLRVSNVFTSFNISSGREDIAKTAALIEYAKKEGLYTSVDVSSRIFKIFNENLSICRCFIVWA